MDLSLRHLITFVALYENDGNVTKTAEKLYMSQPTVSQILAELESYFHEKLFDRISRKLYINSAGTRLYEYSKRVLNMMKDMETGMTNPEISNTIRVGCCDSMDACGLPKYITQFAEIHPAVIVRSSVDTTNSLVEKVLSNELDVAIVDRQINNNQLVCQDFLASRLAVIASPKLGYKDGEEITLEELSHQKVLLREKGSGTREAFEKATQSQGYNIVPVYESVGNGYIISVAAQGMGIGVLPEKMAISYWKRKKLVFLKLKDIELKLIYYFIYHKDKELSKNSKDFLIMCRDFEID